MKTKRRKRHTREQIVKKLRDAGRDLRFSVRPRVHTIINLAGICREEG